MRDKGSSVNHIINNLKVIIEYVNLHSEDKPLKKSTLIVTFVKI
jgi:hypothetical protein